jgi:small-conductance mechanosensitive channel
MAQKERENISSNNVLKKSKIIEEKRHYLSHTHTHSISSSQIMDQLAKYVALFSSAFIVLPAGRDIVAPLTEIPFMGDGKMLSLMNMQGKEARQMMWGIWGVNHVFVSILKVIAVRENDQRMMKMLLWTVLPTLYFLIANNANMAAAGGDMIGFVVLIAAQTVSLSYLAFKKDGRRRSSRKRN